MVEGFCSDPSEGPPAAEFLAEAPQSSMVWPLWLLQKDLIMGFLLIPSDFGVRSLKMTFFSGLCAVTKQG